ncbi:iron ABC transporter permease [Marivirga harenae]|uniref:iron ABC transporter permease n=1 Tax=Marivirga harenae TaxID=2010992 RepID=UPI0026E0C0DB|nr:iron ABC transporter permease [Marivirga harenae]WKV12857.1 iron ABC transporter permease [Marivirga harenae]|tara:strand:- start:17875 stop:18894 length:1020 start_codon:yes stop_codon:yes gene_type:complete
MKLSKYQTVALLIPLLGILFVFSISFGSVYIPFENIIGVLVGNMAQDHPEYHIVLSYRLPKALTIVFAGAALGFSGLQMQTLFRNPLAGPFVLGISSGASLGVAVLVLLGIGVNGALASWGMALSSIIGSSIILLLVVLVSIRLKDSMSLLLVGLMFGAFTSAIVSIMQYFSTADDIQNFLFWTFGATGNLSWGELMIFIPVVTTGLVLGYLQAKPLNALLMGENYAQSMGLKVQFVRLLLVVSTSILAGIVTAFCGPIAFLGLAVPHISRILFKTSNHFILIPATLLIGACLLLICDLIAQVPNYDLILPINAVTSLFGAPVVIWLILKRKNISKNFG